MLPGIRMALAAFLATTLLIGVGFAVIGLLVSARQDGSLALAPAKDPWRTALRPAGEDRPVTLMTAVVEPVGEPTAATVMPEPVVQPSAPMQSSLDGTPIGALPVEAMTEQPAPSASRIESEPAEEPKRVDEVAAVPPNPEPVAPVAEVVTTAIPDVAAAVPEPIVASPAPTEDPAPVVAALEAAVDVTASIAAPQVPEAPPAPAVAQTTPAPTVAEAPRQASLQPAKTAAAPARTAAKPKAKPASRTVAQRKVALRAKARARPRATPRAAAPSTPAPAQSRGLLDGLFGPSATH